MIWIIIGLALFVFIAVRQSRDGNGPTDQRRIFTQSERIQGFARAGNQCEHVSIFGRRCTNAPTHADHHYPHSKGGATAMSNFVALCARHNLTKGSRVPTGAATRRLERRRRAYFPPGMRVDIERKQNRR
jgi:5-methylcytosine-specific restriction endonuclease McrA